MKRTQSCDEEAKGHWMCCYSYISMGENFKGSFLLFLRDQVDKPQEPLEDGPHIQCRPKRREVEMNQSQWP